MATRILTDGAFIPITVLLETAWLLTSRYRYSRERSAAALTALLDMEGLMVAEEPHIRWAMARFAAGGDCADMLHLVASRTAERFLTFDRSLAAHAGSDAPVAIDTLVA